jgi:hypothetical protein
MHVVMQLTKMIHFQRRYFATCSSYVSVVIKPTSLDVIQYQSAYNANYPTLIIGYKVYSWPVQVSPFKVYDVLYLPSALTFRNFVFCPQCIYVFCVDLRTKSEYFSIQH